MNEDKHVVWSNYDLDYKGQCGDLEAEYPELSEDEYISLIYEINGHYLDDERMSLNVQLSQPILVVGDPGLWNGRHIGYKEIPSDNIRDCLYGDTDYSTWYVDRLGDLRCGVTHHNGINHYPYRVYRGGVRDSQIGSLRKKPYRSTMACADTTRMIRRLGDDIAKIYGSSVPRQRQAATIEGQGEYAMAYLLPVKLETHTSWFDILLTVLHEHAESDPYEEHREMAQRLIQHFMTHRHSFTDGYQKECVNLRVHPNEAADTIWLLLPSLSNHYSADKNYHTDLQLYRKNNEQRRCVGWRFDIKP